MMCFYSITMVFLLQSKQVCVCVLCMGHGSPAMVNITGHSYLLTFTQLLKTSLCYYYRDNETLYIFPEPHRGKQVTLFIIHNCTHTFNV